MAETVKLAQPVGNGFAPLKSVRLRRNGLRGKAREGLELEFAQTFEIEIVAEPVVLAPFVGQKRTDGGGGAAVEGGRDQRTGV